MLQHCCIIGYSLTPFHPLGKNRIHPGNSSNIITKCAVLERRNKNGDYGVTQKCAKGTDQDLNVCTKLSKHAFSQFMSASKVWPNRPLLPS